MNERKRRKAFPKVVPLHRAQEQLPGVTMHHGTIVGWSADGGITVQYPGNPLGPLPARSLVKLSAAELDSLVASECPVLLILTAENPPIVAGLTQPVPAVQGRAEETLDPQVASLEGAERVEIRCGKASIVLTKEGKVIVNGTYLSWDSAGALRIRGGSIDMN